MCRFPPGTIFTNRSHLRGACGIAFDAPAVVGVEMADPAGLKFESFDLDIETALLGTFLIDNRTIATARETLKVGDFYEGLHQHIAELCFQFEEEGKSATPLSLNAWVKAYPDIEAVGGALSYMIDLTRAAPAMADVRHLASILVSLRERREALESVVEAEEALRTGASLMGSLEPVIAIADTISEAQTAKGRDTHAGRLSYESLRDIDRQALSEEAFGVSTELSELDHFLKALYPENAIYIGGRPGMGKSILACHLTLAAARQGFQADYWSIEMPAREVTARMIADLDYDLAVRERLKPLHYEDLVKRTVTGEQMQRATQAARTLHDLDIAIFDRDRVTIDEIAAVERARSAKAPDKRRIVIIDHLHIIMPSTRYAGRRVDELSEITGAVKRLAKRIQAPVVMLAQLSRDIEKRDDKRPFMSDFRDSGSIEQDADVVMTVYRHEYYANRAIKAAKNDEQRRKATDEYDACLKKLEIGVLKQRSGATEVIANCFIDVRSSVVRSEQPMPGIRQAGLALGEPLNSLEKMT